MPITESVKVLSDMTEKQTKHINKLETDIIALKERRDKAEVNELVVVTYNWMV